MKKTILSLTLMTLVGSSAIANPIKETKEVKTTESTVTWKGYKVGGSHTGTKHQHHRFGRRVQGQIGRSLEIRRLFWHCQSPNG